MNRNAEAVIEQAQQYASLFDRVSAGDRLEGASSDLPIRLSTDHELLDAAESVSHLIRLAEAERTKLAGEIARRSEPRDNPPRAPDGREQRSEPASRRSPESRGNRPGPWSPPGSPPVPARP